MYCTQSGNKKHRILKQAGILVSLFYFTLTSCEDNSLAAKVGEKELSDDDAFLLMEHEGIDLKSDSAHIAFLTKWSDKEVFLEELRTSNPKEYKLIMLRAEQYAAELAQFKLEEKFLQSKLDTFVSNEELTAFYEQNAADFVLNDYIVQALYFKIPVNIEFRKEQIQHKFLLKKDKDLKDVNAFAKLYAANYHYSDSGWVYFAELAKDIPLEHYNIDNIILNRTKTYFSDENYTYFLNIMDYKMKDATPPFEFLRTELKNIILEQRMEALRHTYLKNYRTKLKSKHEIRINP